MQGFVNGQGHEVVAEAFWQNLHDTVLGNPRKRKPEWIVNFSWSHIQYNNGSTGAVNERMTREQAEALVKVLTDLLSSDPHEHARFRVVQEKHHADQR